MKLCTSANNDPLASSEEDSNWLLSSPPHISTHLISAMYQNGCVKSLAIATNGASFVVDAVHSDISV